MRAVMTKEQRNNLRQLLDCFEKTLSMSDDETILCSRKNIENLVAMTRHLDETCNGLEDRCEGLNKYLENEYGDYE